MASQQSLKNTEDSTGFQAPDPVLCINGCGFFGSVSTMNLCSKCFRSSQIENNTPNSACSKSFTRFSPSNSTQSMEFHSSVPFAACPPPPVDLNSSVLCSESSAEGGISDPKEAKRCFSCKKRVGLTGFRCKCGSMFCGVHRYPEMHECSFDFKGAGREAIAAANPVIRADKLDMI